MREHHHGYLDEQSLPFSLGLDLAKTDFVRPAK
jgi:hypothetical protein